MRSVCPRGVSVCRCLSSWWQGVPAVAQAVQRGCFESHCEERGRRVSYGSTMCNLARPRGRADGDLPSGSPGGTCLDFLAPAPRTCFVRPTQSSRLRWLRWLVSFAFPTLATRRRGRARLLDRLLIGVDLQSRLKR